jgi:L,D-transpeptidase YcbB
MFKPGVLSSLALLIFFLLFSCKTTINSTGTLSPVAMADPDPILIPADSSHACYALLKNKTTVIQFYRKRKGKSIWFDQQNNLNALSDSLMAFVNRANYYGLVPQDYLLNQPKGELVKNVSANDSLLKIETGLTDAFMSLCADLNSGKNFKGNTLRDSIAISVLTQAIVENRIRQALESREPSVEGYQSLKRALKVLIESVLNDRHIDSLQALGKIQSININLDRWRQEQTIFGSRYVYVNIPSFMLRVVENETTIFSSKIIVGAVRTPTPDITSLIECFTIYPYWHVPRKIAVEEYLPVIQKDTSFISRNNFDVLDKKGKILNAETINWSKYHKNYFPVSLRQREGEENSLGIIKFVFDNPHAVYLHDTNAKRLFSSSRRAFSHGCIRTERAIELAHYLITGRLNQKSEGVQKYIGEKQRHTMNLKTPMPIYIRYFTAEVVDGELLLYDDVYQRDQTSNRAHLTGLRAAIQH